MSHAAGTNVYTYNSYKSDVYKKVNSPLLKRCMRGGSLLEHTEIGLFKLMWISRSQETMGGTKCKHSQRQKGHYGFLLFIFIKASRNEW